MKKKFLISLMLMVTLFCAAKSLKTLRVTTEPQMVCTNCENKIKKNIRFEKGIHEISTDLEGQVVTIVYDADKTNEENIINAFGKIKYKATLVSDSASTASPAPECNSEKGACCTAKENGKCCTSEKKACAGEKKTCNGKGKCCTDEKKACNGEGQCCKDTVK